MYHDQNPQTSETFKVLGSTRRKHRKERKVFCFPRKVRGSQHPQVPHQTSGGEGVHPGPAGECKARPAAYKGESEKPAFLGPRSLHHIHLPPRSREFSPRNPEAAKPPEMSQLQGGPCRGRVPGSLSHSGSLARARLILLSKLYKILILQSGNLGGKKNPAMGKCWLCSTRHSVLRGSIIKTLIQLFLFK